MKVVIFCGGLGTRLREHNGTTPKSLVPIGNRPIIWHLMKYYAHFGHKDFILCLGFMGDSLKEYFLSYNPYLSIDFTRGPNGALSPERSDIDDWKITFVDTGLHSNIGERLLQVREYLEGEEVFLANYSDVLSDLPLNDYLENFLSQSEAVAGFVAVKPSQSFHTVEIDPEGQVSDIQSVSRSNVWVNGGYMVLRSEFFDFIRPGEELVEEPFRRLIAKRQLFAQTYTGFWAAMDTYKEKITFDRMYGRGERPWMLWDRRDA
jgi:glucose-1-phosphate cytidylyltransferase